MVGRVKDRNGSGQCKQLFLDMFFENGPDPGSDITITSVKLRADFLENIARHLTVLRRIGIPGIIILSS